MAIDLDYNDYILRSNIRVKNPPRLASDFINLDRMKYLSFQRETKYVLSRTYWLRFRNRISTHLYHEIRAAYRKSTFNGKKYLPGIKFFWKDLLNSEWLAVVDWKKYHRDHLIHQNLTAYIGMVLLNGEYNQGGNHKTIQFAGMNLKEIIYRLICEHPSCQYFRDYALSLGIEETRFQLNNFNRRFWEGIILNTFFAAAMFHDIGYPWQFVNKMQDNLNHHDFLNNDKLEEAAYIYEHFQDKLLFYPFSGYHIPDRLHPVIWRGRLIEMVREILSESHGLPSAIAFTYLNDLLREFPDEHLQPWQILCIDWASMIIMMHDLSGFYGKADKIGIDYVFIPKYPQLRIVFEKDPLSAILTLSDFIQDFERFNVEFDDPVPPAINLNYKVKCSGVSLEWNARPGVFSIKYKYPNSSDRYDKNRRIKKEKFLFFDPISGYLDLSYLGINHVDVEAIR